MPNVITGLGSDFEKLSSLPGFSYSIIMGAASSSEALASRGAEDAAKVWSLLALAELEPPIDSETMLHSKWIP